MNGWLDQLHGGSTAFPPVVTAIKLAVALAIGLLIGFERQWSHKDFGVRTFSLTALLGALTALISTPVMLMGMLATVLLAVLLNVRDIVASRSVEGTTSVALVVTFVLGALIGNGHMFTSVACAIVATWLLSLKPQFKQFAGGVRAEEIRSAVLLGLFGFVIWPLLPDRYVDPWRLLEPREAWVTVVVVAGIGFANYVLLRVYGKRGIALTAILGGLVNSTAAAAELAAILPAAGLPLANCPGCASNFRRDVPSERSLTRSFWQIGGPVRRTSVTCDDGRCYLFCLPASTGGCKSKGVGASPCISRLPKEGHQFRISFYRDPNCRNSGGAVAGQQWCPVGKCDRGNRIESEHDRCRRKSSNLWQR